MSKKIKYGIWVEGTEEKAQVNISDSMTHLQFYALLKHMLDMAFSGHIDGVPDGVKNDMMEKMIADARAKKP